MKCLMLDLRRCFLRCGGGLINRWTSDLFVLVVDFFCLLGIIFGGTMLGSGGGGGETHGGGGGGGGGEEVVVVDDGIKERS